MIPKMQGRGGIESFFFFNHTYSWTWGRVSDIYSGVSPVNTSNNITASLYLSCFVNEREARGGGGGRSFYHLLQSSTQRVRHHTVASRASYLISYILPTPKTAIQIQNKTNLRILNTVATRAEQHRISYAASDQEVNR